MALDKMSPDERRGGRPAKGPFLHIPVPWVFVLGYLVGVGFQVLAPVRVGSSAATTAVQVAGSVVVLAGLALAAWAWSMFKQAGTSRVPGETSRVLVTSGPYGFTRNPMYVGLALAYLGETGALLQVWPVPMLIVVLAYVNWCVIPVEEANLKEFTEYGDYCARARRWL